MLLKPGSVYWVEYETFNDKTIWVENRSCAYIPSLHWHLWLPIGLIMQVPLPLQSQYLGGTDGFILTAATTNITINTLSTHIHLWSFHWSSIPFFFCRVFSSFFSVHKMAKTLLLVHSTGNWHMYNITLNCHNWYSDARLKLKKFKTSVINSKAVFTFLSYNIHKQCWE